MSVFFKSVVQSINLEKCLNNANERKIVIYGPDENNNILYDVLKSEGYEIYRIINSDEINFIRESIKNCNEDFYIFITDDYDEEVEKYLNINGYEEVKDYLYIIHKPVVVVKDEKYTDIYGNKIKAPKGTKFKFLGYNSIININTEIKDKIEISCTGSSIDIGSKCSIGENITIECNGKSSINIGDNCLIGDNVNISCVNHSKMNLTSPCKIRKESLVGAIENSSINLGEKTSFYDKTVFFAKKEGSINIGKGSHSGENLRCITFFGGKIDIGADCMFSEYISFVNNDGHPIFDVKSGKQINTKKDIIVGEHVWIGIKATILSGTEIGEASIIGADSLVNKKFPNNCIIAGNPAKLIRKDIAWDREITNSDDIDKSVYWNMTFDSLN